MKMCLFNGFFWGLILILIGISLILKFVFNIHFPVLRFFIAIIFIYLGFHILLGTFGFRKHTFCETYTKSTKYEYIDDKGNYSSVFGNGSVDLRNTILTENRQINISSVFSDFNIYMKKETNYIINSNSVFGKVSYEKNGDSILGNNYFQSENFNPNLPHFIINANVVFGKINVILE